MKIKIKKEVAPRNIIARGYDIGEKSYLFSETILIPRSFGWPFFVPQFS